MEIQCFFFDCKSFNLLKCECGIVSCPVHSEQHTQKRTNHKFESLSAGMNPQFLQIASVHLLKKLSCLHMLRKKLLKDQISIIQAVNESFSIHIKNLRLLEYEILKLASNLVSNKIMTFEEKNQIDETLKYNYNVPNNT